MNLAIKNDYSANVGEVAAHSTDTDAVTDSQTLRNQQLALQAELKTCMSAGDAAGVIRIQNQLRELPVRIRAAEIAEIHRNIDKANTRLDEIKTEIRYIEQIRADKDAILAEKIAAVEEAGVAVRRVDFALFQLGNEAENMRQARREYHARLNKFLEDAEQKMEINYERF